MKTLSISLGFFYFGYSIVVLSPMAEALSWKLGLDKAESEMAIYVANSLFYVGNMVGSLISGRQRRFFKAKLMMITDVVGILACLLMAVDSIGFILISRLIQGYVCGIFTSVIPVYVAETTPKKLSGLFGGIYHIFLPLGVTICFLLSSFLP